MTFDIKKRREQLGITQQQIADFVGVSGATISRWESGDIKNARQDKIEKLSMILNVSPVEIIGMETDLDKKLSESEQMLLSAYKNADPKIQEAVCRILEIPFEQETTLSDSVS